MTLKQLLKIYYNLNLIHEVKEEAYEKMFSMSPEDKPVLSDQLALQDLDELEQCLEDVKERIMKKANSGKEPDTIATFISSDPHFRLMQHYYLKDKQTSFKDSNIN